MVLILYCSASTNQAGPHMPRWFCSHRQVPIPLYSQIVARASESAKAGTVALIAHRPFS